MYIVPLLKLETFSCAVVSNHQQNRLFLCVLCALCFSLFTFEVLSGCTRASQRVCMTAVSCTGKRNTPEKRRVGFARDHPQLLKKERLIVKTFTHVKSIKKEKKKKNRMFPCVPFLWFLWDHWNLCQIDFFCLNPFGAPDVDYILRKKGIGLYSWSFWDYPNFLALMLAFRVSKIENQRDFVQLK